MADRRLKELGNTTVASVYVCMNEEDQINHASVITIEWFVLSVEKVVRSSKEGRLNLAY